MILTVTINPLIDKTYFVDEMRYGEIQRVHEIKILPGGKGANVARLLKTLGAEVEAFVVVGGECGKFYLRLMQDEGLKVISFERNQPTRYSTAVFEQEKNHYTTFIEESPDLTAGEIAAARERIIDLLPKYSAVVISGSFPGKYAHFYAEIISAAKRHGLMTVLDSYGEAFRKGVETGPFFVKPNRHEFESTFGKKLESDADYACAFRFLMMKGVELAIITDGARGFRACYKNELHTVTPPDIEEVNSVGSGDAVVACIVYGLRTGMDFEENLRRAAAAGCANAAEYEACYCKMEAISQYMLEVKIKKTAL